MVKTYLLILITLFSITILNSMYGQVAINTTGNPPAASAMLDIDAANRGFLPPRVALLEANNPLPVNAPATGLLVYNTNTHGQSPNQVTPGYYSWNGSRWLPVSPPSGNAAGDMAYWNGSTWVIIPAGSYGQSLILCNGVPTWGGCLALVSTDTVTNISIDHATLIGAVTSEGGTAVVARGFCWDTIPAPDITDGHSLNGSGSGIFTHTASGLQQHRTYYVRAYATNSKGTTYGAEKSFITGSVSPGSSTITYQGVTYNTVIIGTQTWLKQNLNVGTMIPGTQDQANNSTIEKYCYDNNEANCTLYGGLYQWNEAMQYFATPGSQGICPPGWHIPADAEWSVLVNYLGGSSNSGGDMKETGTTHWAAPNEGASNASLLTKLPGGYRDNSGAFQQLTLDAYFWSSTMNSPSTAWSRNLGNDSAETLEAEQEQVYGFSIRCISN